MIYTLNTPGLVVAAVVAVVLGLGRGETIV